MKNWPFFLRLTLAFVLHWLQGGRARAENHVDYRFESYNEENGRIEVNTHSVLFESQLIDSLDAKGELIYDGISGASPTGSPPLAGTKGVPLAKLSDIRRAVNFELDWRYGHQTFSPQISYSTESDYDSIGISLNDAIEFNQKNTTLRLGIAHSFDEVQPDFFPEAKHKDSTDALVGLSQLLSANTILTADFTYGTSSGYLNDPYKFIRFDGWLPATFIFPENRPRHRTREVLLLTLTQFVEPMRGSAEISYRFHHDSFEVFSHTAALTWHQKLGKKFVVSPGFRYYQQSAAEFYRIGVPGFVPSDNDPARPKFYSADYRLSRMNTFTYGIQAMARVTEWLSIDAGYQRYEMFGLDHKTSDSAYPKANIFNVGLRLWF